MGSSRATRREWQRHVRAWRSSGLSSGEYAARAGINANTLVWWRWRIGKEKGRPQVERTKPARTKPAGVEFVEVSAPLPGISRSEVAKLELEMAGVVVRLAPDFDAAALDRVLGVLEARR